MSNEGCVVSHHHTWIPLSPNEVVRIIEQVSNGEEKDGAGGDGTIVRREREKLHIKKINTIERSRGKPKQMERRRQ